jgi:hypothetical protein
LRLSSVKRYVLLVAICALGVMARVAAAAAEDITPVAQQVMTKYSDAVVTVSMAIKMQMNMEGRTESGDIKIEVNGTIVDPSGLTVVSLFETSPEDAMARMGGEDDSASKVSAETRDVRIRLGSGTEIPAKVVLRDRDLDLAFIRPTQKPAAPLPFVDLAVAAKLNPLDQIIALDRLGKLARHVAAIRIDRIQAVIDKPRTLYVPSHEGLKPALGTPIFGPDGKVAGIMVVRLAPSSSQDQGSSSEDRYLFVALPAEDVLEIAKQAPEQAIEEKKIEAPKPVPAPKPTAPAPKPGTAPKPKPAPKPK